MIYKTEDIHIPTNPFDELNDREKSDRLKIEISKQLEKFEREQQQQVAKLIGHGKEIDIEIDKLEIKMKNNIGTIKFNGKQVQGISKMNINLEVGKNTISMEIYPDFFDLLE